MYLVKIYDGPDDKKGIRIHSPSVNRLKLNSGIIKKEVEKIDSFNFTFDTGNPGYRRVRPLHTLVNVLNTKTNKYEFEGRALYPTEDMAESGEVATSFICEGELGYLYDAPQRHLEFRGSVVQLLKTILDYFNSQVEPYKRFEIGNVTVTDPNDFVYLYLSAEKTTYDSIQDALIDRLGGELQIRKENGVRYLDYLIQVGRESEVEIKLQKNLLSVSRKIDPTNIITRLTPLGARIESEDETATDASQARITIDSVNNGLPFIDRHDLIKEFGIRGGSVTFDDVNSPSLVKTRGVSWMDNQKLVLYQHSIEAIDLSKIGLEFEQFEKGNTHKVINPVMNMNEFLRIISKTIDINVPHNDALTVGDKFKNANEYQVDLNKRSRRIVELQNEVAYTRKDLAKTKTDMTKRIQLVQDTIDSIDVSDLPELRSILTSVQAVVDNLVIVVGEIPIYDLATSTTPGLLSSDLWLKLSNLQLATGLIDGLLAKEDKVKLNNLQVTKKVDLDQLVADVKALQGNNTEGGI